MNEVTRILDAIHEGQPQAAAELLTLVYEELRRMAATKMAQENARQTLQPTALVHEAWLRLGGEDQPTWENRAHFFGAAAEAMRRILVERARRRLRLRHGGGQERVDFDEWRSPRRPTTPRTFSPSLDLRGCGSGEGGVRPTALLRGPISGRNGQHLGCFPDHGQALVAVRPRLAEGGIAPELSLRTILQTSWASWR
jgi:hypothetical protein